MSKCVSPVSQTNTNAIPRDGPPCGLHHGNTLQKLEDSVTSVGAYCNSCKFNLPNFGPAVALAFASNDGASAGVGEVGWVHAFASNVIALVGVGEVSWVHAFASNAIALVGVGGWGVCPKRARLLDDLPVRSRLNMGSSILEQGK